jgi:hypothetical protein
MTIEWLDHLPLSKHICQLKTVLRCGNCDGETPNRSFSCFLDFDSQVISFGSHCVGFPLLES